EPGAREEPRAEERATRREQPAEDDEERKAREHVAVEARERPERARGQDRREDDEHRVDPEVERQLEEADDDEEDEDPEEDQVEGVRRLEGGLGARVPE